MNKDIKLTWEQLRELLMYYNEIPGKNGTSSESKEPIHAVAVFSSDNWPDKDYSLESRSYRFTSDNKAFKSWCSGYSCFASSLAGDDPCVDLTKVGWKIEYCYLL